MTDVGYATRQWYVNNGMAVNDQYRGLDFFTRALHPDDRHLITDFREAAKRGENPKLQALVRVNEKDGHWDYQKVFSAVTKFDPEHNVVEVSAITQNVTEQIAMEQNLIEAKERAESADKMKTAFLASMSHEIRTPLNSIIGFSRLLCQDDINKKDKGEIVKIVEKNNQSSPVHGAPSLLLTPGTLRVGSKGGSCAVAEYYEHQRQEYLRAPIVGFHLRPYAGGRPGSSGRRCKRGWCT